MKTILLLLSFFVASTLGTILGTMGVGSEVGSPLIPGTYEVEAKPDPAIWELFKSIDVPKVKLDKLKRCRSKMIIVQSGDHYHVDVLCGDRNKKLSIHPGKEVDDLFINGRMCKLLVKVDGAKAVGYRKFPDYDVVTTGTFTKTGIEVTFTAKGRRATVQWKRLHIVEEKQPEEVKPDTDVLE